MTINIIFSLLLLGHILGDFYFQGSDMAERKDKDPMCLLAHGVIYMLCMAVVLRAGILFSQDLVSLWLSASILHFTVDFFKRYIKGKKFIIDQCLHLVSLGLVWWIWGKDLTISCFAKLESAYIPNRPVLLIVLGLLCILRPIGLLISKGDIWDFSKSDSAPNESQKGAGKMIGYLERIIIFFLLLNGQYGAIAFVIAAKSVARFPEIGKNNEGRSLAEYYLIGTLLSMVSVFSVALLLGLIKSS